MVFVSKPLIAYTANSSHSRGMSGALRYVCQQLSEPPQVLAKLAEEGLRAMLLTSKSSRPGSRPSVEGQMGAALGGGSKLGQLAKALQRVFVSHAQKVIDGCVLK